MLVRVCEEYENMVDKYKKLMEINKELNVRLDHLEVSKKVKVYESIRKSHNK